MWKEQYVWIRNIHKTVGKNYLDDNNNMMNESVCWTSQLNEQLNHLLTCRHNLSNYCIFLWIISLNCGLFHTYTFMFLLNKGKKVFVFIFGIYMTDKQHLKISFLNYEIFLAAIRCSHREVICPAMVIWDVFYRPCLMITLHS